MWEPRCTHHLFYIVSLGLFEGGRLEAESPMWAVWPPNTLVNKVTSDMSWSWYRFSLSHYFWSSPWFVVGHMLPPFLFYLSSKDYGIILNHTIFYLVVGSASLGWMHMLCLGMLQYVLGSTYWPRDMRGKLIDPDAAFTDMRMPTNTAKETIKDETLKPVNKITLTMVPPQKQTKHA